MADEKKIVTQDIFEKAISDVLQVVAENTFDFVEYESDEVDALFDVESPEKLAYYESLINPDLISENRLWASKTISDKLQQLQLDCNSYADEIATRTLTTEIVTSTSEVTKENVLYLILSDSSTNTYEQYMLIGGTATPLGSTKIDLSDVYTKSEMDTKLNTKANDNEVLKLDNILTTTGNETNDNVYSAKLTKTELDKKANDNEVVKKTDISTTINSTSTNDKVAGAKAVYDSLANKLDKTVILTTADEVNSFDREYQSFIIEPSVAEAVGLPKAPDSTWFCINLSHVKGFKYPSQIAFEYAGIERIMYRTAHNGVWHNWRKIPTTSVSDVGITYINTFEDETYVKPTGTNACSYHVINGHCIVTLQTFCLSTSQNFVQIVSGLPKPKTFLYANAIDRNMTSNSGARGVFQITTSGAINVVCNYGDASVTAGRNLYATFSYPVAKS